MPVRARIVRRADKKGMSEAYLSRKSTALDGRIQGQTTPGGGADTFFGLLRRCRKTVNSAGPANHAFATAVARYNTKNNPELPPIAMSKAAIEHCRQRLSGANGIPRRYGPGPHTAAARARCNDADTTVIRGPRHYLKLATFWALFVLLAAALPLLGKGRSADYGLAIQRAAPGFTLTDTAGRAVALEDFAGRFVYLMFGYLNCPDVCHTQALLFEELNLAAGRPDDLTFVFIAIDPERDTRESVHAYFDERGAGFISLHGDAFSDLQSLALQYHASFRRNPGDPDYLIDHTGVFYLLGPDGRLRYTYAANQNATPRLLTDLSQLRLDYEQL